MKPYVLVHGSNCGSWVWKEVAPRLRAAGHEVHAPTLTGLADRSHLLKCGVNLTTHITDIVNLLVYNDLSDVVLVGHSYAGMVITGVAATLPERIGALVYLDAYVPEAGQSESDLWPPERRAIGKAGESNGLAQPPPLALFGVTDPVLAAWINSKMTPQPVATYTEAVPAGNGRSRLIPRVFIHCTGNPATTPDVFGPFAAKASQAGWPVREIASGHFALLTAPADVVSALLPLGADAV